MKGGKIIGGQDFPDVSMCYRHRMMSLVRRLPTGLLLLGSF